MRLESLNPFRMRTEFVNLSLRDPRVEDQFFNLYSTLTGISMSHPLSYQAFLYSEGLTIEMVHVSLIKKVAYKKNH